MESRSLAPHTFLDALWDVQRREGLSDPQLAGRIGVSWATISRLKSTDPAKRRNPGIRVVQGALTEWPELGYVLAGENRSRAPRA